MKLDQQWWKKKKSQLIVEEEEEKNEEGEWYSDILQYLKDGTYPKFADKND